MPHAIPTLIATATVVVTAVAGATIATAEQRPTTNQSRQTALAVGPLPHRTTGEAAIQQASVRRARPAQKPLAPKARSHTHRVASRSAPSPHRRSQPGHVAVAPLGPTHWPALNLAIARIPGSGAERVRWIVTGRYGYWGTADWYAGAIYISPSVPQSKLYAVAVHEWSHLLSIQPYGGDVRAAVAAMDRVFGGNGLTGAERAADCMARLQGARWTHYTSCQVSAWRVSAALLLHGSQL
jgi:hypothetical protein